MSNKPPRHLSRRELLEESVRGLALAALGLLTAVLVKKSARRPGNQECVNQGICRGCRVFSACGLPQALSAKTVLRRT